LRGNLLQRNRYILYHEFDSIFFQYLDFLNFCDIYNSMYPDYILKLYKSFENYDNRKYISYINDFLDFYKENLSDIEKIRNSFEFYDIDEI
jgi:Ca2+-binding EF-hand superfamily protein